MAFVSVKADDGNLQIINLSPDTIMNLVEVSIGDSILIDSLDFNEATAYLTIPEGNNQELTFKSVNYPTEEFVLSNLNISSAGFFQSILYGVINTVDYSPNPDGNSLDLNATFKTVDTSNINNSELRVNFFHATSDAVELDVADFILEYIVDDMSFGMYSSTDTDIPNNFRNIFFTSTDSVVTVASRSIDLSTISGKTLTIFLSGFLVTDDNNNGPSFGIYSVDEAGNVNSLDLISSVFPIDFASEIQLAPNPAKQYTYLQFNNKSLTEISLQLIDINGRQLQTDFMQLNEGFNQIKVELPEVQSGLYFLILESNGLIHSMPLVIAR